MCLQWLASYNGLISQLHTQWTDYIVLFSDNCRHKQISILSWHGLMNCITATTTSTSELHSY